MPKVELIGANINGVANARVCLIELNRRTEGSVGLMLKAGTI